MKKLELPITPALCLLYAVLAFASGCGKEQVEIQTTLAPTNSCETGMAVIQVGDGFFQTLCGCQEPDFTIAYSGSSLTCTVSVNTTVIFHYKGSVLFHQILSDGSPSFSSSPMSNPRALLPVVSHAADFSTSGTFRFYDAFNTAASGNIVVQ